MYGKIQAHLKNELNTIQQNGLYKKERIITSPQGAEIVVNGETVLNFCSNNYLGLSSHPEVVQAAKDALDSHGFGMSSVRFICGTQDIHKQLEAAIADFYGTEDTILYAAAFDANGGVFEPLLGEEDCIISDSLNHASIIDGVRLCKASRYRYANNDMIDLENQLIEANKQNHRFKIIVTDGVFSMDGDIAKLNLICDLAEKYDALVEENIKLNEENSNLIQLGVIYDLKEGLSLVESEKFDKLAKLVEFTKDQTYVEKLNTIFC